jgi:hypothetical protein
LRSVLFLPFLELFFFFLGSFFLGPSPAFWLLPNPARPLHSFDIHVSTSLHGSNSESRFALWLFLRFWIARLFLSCECHRPFPNAQRVRIHFSHSLACFFNEPSTLHLNIQRRFFISRLRPAVFSSAELYLWPPNHYQTMTNIVSHTNVSSFRHSSPHIAQRKQKEASKPNEGRWKLQKATKDERYPIGQYA